MVDKPTSARHWASLRAKLLSHAWLYNPKDGSPPGFSVLGILQAWILESVSISSSRGLSRPRGWTCISYIFCIGGSLPLEPAGKPYVIIISHQQA